MINKLFVIIEAGEFDENDKIEKGSITFFVPVRHAHIVLAKGGRHDDGRHVVCVESLAQKACRKILAKEFECPTCQIRFCQCEDDEPNGL